MTVMLSDGQEPTWTSRDVRVWLAERARRRFRQKATHASLVVIAGCWLVMGLGHLLGPDAWRSSTSYEVISQWVPLRVWGGLFVLIGLVDLLAAYSRVRFARFAVIAGASVAAAWGVSFVAAALVDKLTGAGWPLWFYFSFSQVMLSGFQVHRGR